MEPAVNHECDKAYPKQVTEYMKKGLDFPGKLQPLSSGLLNSASMCLGR